MTKVEDRGDRGAKSLPELKPPSVFFHELYPADYHEPLRWWCKVLLWYSCLGHEDHEDHEKTPGSGASQATSGGQCRLVGKLLLFGR